MTSLVKEILSVSCPDGSRLPLMRTWDSGGRATYFTVEGRQSSAPTLDAPGYPLDIDRWLTVVAHCPVCSATTDQAHVIFKVGQLFHEVSVVACPVCVLHYKTRQASPSLLSIIYGPEYTLHRPLTEADIHSNLPRVDRLGRVPGRLLDYGCGNGQFVAAADSRGWDAIGADAYLKGSKSHLQRNLDLRKFDACDPDAMKVLGSFDVITAWALIEHLPRPLQTLQALSRLLRPGGRLIFNAPNGDSWAARHQGANWRLATAIEHLHFLTPVTAVHLAKKLELICEKISVCGSPFSWNSGDGGLHDQGVDRCWEEIAGIAPASTKAFAKESAPHAPQVALEVIGKQGLRGLLRSFIGLLHVGDHIEVVLRKPMV